MPRPGIDPVDHTQDLTIAFPLDLDLRVEVTAGLQVVEEVAFAFIEQVVVEGILLENRDLLLQHTPADTKALGRNRYHRARIDLEDVVDNVGCRTIFLSSDGDLGQNPPMFLVSLAQPLQGIVNPCGGDAVTGIHPRYFQYLDIGETSFADNFNLANMGGRTRADMEKQVHLLVR